MSKLLLFQNYVSYKCSVSSWKIHPEKLLQLQGNTITKFFCGMEKGWYNLYRTHVIFYFSGYEMNWAAFHIVEIMASTKLRYLIFHDDTNSLLN